MFHIHTSLVSSHKSNNKILRKPPPHISSSAVILPRLTRRTLAKLRTNKSYFHKVDANSHPSPLFPLCNTHTQHTSSLQLQPHTHHLVTPEFMNRPRRSYCTASQIDSEAGWWTTSEKIRLTPLAMAKGMGRQQQQEPLS